MTEKLLQGALMHAMDLLVLALGSAVTMIVFVQKANIEKSKVRVRIKRK